MRTIGQPYVPFGPGDELHVVKDLLRRAIVTERAKRQPRERERAALDIAQVVGDLDHVRSAAVVAAYASRAEEPGTVPLLDRLAGRGARVLLPVLGVNLTRQWAWLTTTDELTQRAPGRPPEPPGPGLDADTLALADAVVVPALAVDSTGHRLGHGGGWYPRGPQPLPPRRAGPVVG
ncbi:MAG TPA: 5-formyltetrahydrofolate cyclo-ligase, partial [Actinotalea sp.]|nr:5-formyltetrahydrofolate cyclo-ligase [Actinotalea sp.]